MSKRIGSPLSNLKPNRKQLCFEKVRIFENNQDLIKQIALGILLSSYKFNNYKKNKSKDGTEDYCCLRRP